MTIFIFNRNRAINFSFELILQILCKGNYFLVTNQIFSKKSDIILHFFALFPIYTPSKHIQPCLSKETGLDASPNTGGLSLVMDLSKIMEGTNHLNIHRVILAQKDT